MLVAAVMRTVYQYNTRKTSVTLYFIHIHDRVRVHAIEERSPQCEQTLLSLNTVEAQLHARLMHPAVHIKSLRTRCYIHAQYAYEERYTAWYSLSRRLYLSTLVVDAVIMCCCCCA